MSSTCRIKFEPVNTDDQFSLGKITEQAEGGAAEGLKNLISLENLYVKFRKYSFSEELASRGQKLLMNGVTKLKLLKRMSLILEG